MAVRPTVTDTLSGSNRPVGRVRWDRPVLLAAPVLLVLGWVSLIANAGRGANDAWAVGHLILFIANAFWIPAVLVLQRLDTQRSRKWLRPIALGLVVFGSLCVAAQLAVDLVAWALALEGATLSNLFAAIRARPPLALLFYLVGPPLLFLGVALAVVPLVGSGGRQRTAASLVVGGLVAVLVGALSSFSLVTLAGWITVLVGFGLLAAAVGDIAHAPWSP